jgi:TRAP-type C4-dicarboxylate transport system substrate-binding protein
LTSTPTAVDAKFWEVLDFYVPAAVTMGIDFVTVNLDEFNKLDQATKDALIQAGKEMEAAMWDKVAQIEKDAEAEVNKNGIQTLAPSDQLMNDLAKVTEKIRADWLKQAPAEAQEIVQKFNEAVGR